MMRHASVWYYENITYRLINLSCIPGKIKSIRISLFIRDRRLLRKRTHSPAEEHAEQHNNYRQADNAGKKTGNQELVCN